MCLYYRPKSKSKQKQTNRQTNKKNVNTKKQKRTNERTNEKPKKIAPQNQPTNQSIVLRINDDDHYSFIYIQFNSIPILGKKGQIFFHLLVAAAN